MDWMLSFSEESVGQSSSSSATLGTRNRAASKATERGKLLTVPPLKRLKKSRVLWTSLKLDAISLRL